MMYMDAYEFVWIRMDAYGYVWMWVSERSRDGDMGIEPTPRTRVIEVYGCEWMRMDLPVRF
jgi:hypothetical protein